MLHRFHLKKFLGVMREVIKSKTQNLMKKNICGHFHGWDNDSRVLICHFWLETLLLFFQKKVGHTKLFLLYNFWVSRLALLML